MDLIAQLNGSLLRIQVKTSTQVTAVDGGMRRPVSLATRGGNQSWNRVSRRFDSSRFDYLFVLTGDGRRWFIPAGAIEAETCIALGGDKYSEFEIEPGREIDPLVYEAALESTAPAGEYPSGQRTAPVKRQAYAFAGSNPASPTAENRGPATGARTRLSKSHQVTIPMSQFEAAELHEGDRFRVMAAGRGRIELTRVEELVGQLPLEPPTG